MRKFTFRFEVQWAVGGEDTPEEEKTLTIEAPSWEDAIKQLRFGLGGLTEQFSSNFTVSEDGGPEVRMQTRHPYWQDTVYQGTDLYETEFVRPDSIAP